LRRIVLLLAGLHTEKCPQAVSDQIRRVQGVSDVHVGPILQCEHRTVRVQCEYGLAQVLFDPDVVTCAKILSAVKPPYWADVIVECPLTPPTEKVVDERKRVAIFA